MKLEEALRYRESDAFNTVLKLLHSSALASTLMEDRLTVISIDVNLNITLSGCCTAANVSERFRAQSRFKA